MYIAEEYSIADMACYPWFDGNVNAWHERMSARPAVKRGMSLEGGNGRGRMAA